MNEYQIALEEYLDSEVSPEYVNWMNDAEVTKYLESRFQFQDLASISEYVSAMKNSATDILFKILEANSKNHIGNLRIGQINEIHKTCVLGIIIGNKSYWGKGFASEAIKLGTEFALSNLGMTKVTAGCYSLNVGSRRAFEKAGFHLEATLRNQVSVDQGRDDLLLLSYFSKSNSS